MHTRMLDIVIIDYYFVYQIKSNSIGFTMSNKKQWSYVTPRTRSEIIEHQRVRRLYVEMELNRDRSRLKAVHKLFAKFRQG